MPIRDVVEVEWSSGLFSSGWRLVDGSREFTFPKLLLNRVPKSCLDGQVLPRLKRAVGGEFIAWWVNEALEPDASCFGLRFPVAGWSLPWEVLVGILKPTSAHRASIVRRLEARQAASPTSFAERLRVLIVQGAASDPNDSSMATLALDQERDGLLLSWDLLDEAVRSGVERPRVSTQGLAGVSNDVGASNPHVLVFSGHGRVRGTQTELLTADGKWVTGSEFAQAIGSANHYPAFVMLWACNSGRDGSTRPGSWAPALAQSLLNAGCIAVLAMQDAISDASAILLARECLTLLAQGVPIDRAVAEARAQLLTQRPQHSHPRDWASPTVWSAASIVSGIKWASPAPELAERQLAAARLLRGTFERVGGLIEGASPDEDAKAAGWLQGGRTWVVGDPALAEHAYRWVRILRILQVRNPVVVLAIDLKHVNVELGLQRWAELVKEYTLPGELPQPFGEKIRELERSTREAWEELSTIPGCFLAIALPSEPTEAAPWFWDPLVRQAGGARWAILATERPPVGTSPIDIDNLEPVPMDAEAVKAATRGATRLVHALAALNAPLPSAYIQVEQDSGPQRLEEWPEAGSLTIETGYGPVLRGSVRQKVFLESSVSELALGARDAAAILSDDRVHRSIDIRERRLGLFLRAGLIDEALIEAADLAVLHRNQDQPRLTLSTAEHLDRVDTALKLSLPTRGKLMLASAHLALGDVEDGLFWLERAEPQDALEQALRHALLAEVAKSSPDSGARERALAEIEEAISVCQQQVGRGNHGPELRRALRAYRQDRARILQYLFYERERALVLYEELLAEWGDERDAAVDVAVVTRNYAECLRALKTNGPADLELASSLLLRRIETLRGRSSAPVLPELHYELAKTLSEQGADGGERSQLSAGRLAAEASGYDMMVALIRNREFWRFREFSHSEWRDRAKALDRFARHGWAARALINGRISAAKRLAETGETSAAIAELEQAQGAIDRFSASDQGSDRWRRAAVASGIDFLREGRVPGPAWHSFVESAPWAGQWLAGEGMTAAQVWDAWDDRKRR